MSANTSNTVYRNKNMTKFTAIPNHGDPGWIEENGEFKELIYWNKDGKAEWITATEFKESKLAIKKRNIAYYRNHPGELNKKIAFKKINRSRCGYLDGSVFGFHTTW